ncbi:MAG: His/Gly/Thr/Pro-type tRNA ligase C-terminal domain-containing protein, partial [Bacilli bacterium]|nr:His/Gly/Thr/Pro-type tRNA ligase C-terminal domain-containing protein [Bacilli bacterium]
DTEALRNIPKTIEYLNEESKKHFDDVKAYLDELEIDYEVNPSIVRGLDYYTHTVFEVEASVEGFGSQNVLCGGGRYNNLVETMEGPATPGVGFALGMERLLTALEFEKIELDYDKGIDLYIIPMSENEKAKAMSLTQSLRLNGFSVDTDYMNRNLKNNFKQADRLNSKFIVIVGEEEVTTKILTIKNNSTKEEYKVKIDDLITFMDEMIGEDHE